MDFLKYKDIIEEGDLVIVYLNVHNMYPITLKHGQVFQSKYGALKHSDVIGKKYGNLINCSRGWVYVLFPTSELWTTILPHRTQILYSNDISLIILQLDLKPGSVVCEAGTGSGSLSHALARTISPDGFLHTFDFHEQRVEAAKEEFKTHGLDKIVRVQHRDVGAHGFGISNVSDAVFLDLPRPWEVIRFVQDAMKVKGGRFCSFSPCMEQVQRTCLALQACGFRDITTMECLQRHFEVKKVLLPTLKSKTPSRKVKAKQNNISHDSSEENFSSLDSKMDPSNPPESTDTPMLEDNEFLTSVQTEVKEPSQFKNTTIINDSFWTAVPPLQIPGHTGYLTFATLLHHSIKSGAKEEILEIQDLSSKEGIV